MLVGTVSIEKSERLASMLERRGIKHEVLNAKHHKREAEIVAQAGRKGAVTIATNMAGRGTDIILGGNPRRWPGPCCRTNTPRGSTCRRDEWDDLVREIEEREQMKAEGEQVKEMGGLHIIGTERHEARRIDLQLRGRCGRQGDPGTSRFYLSLEDDLMRIFAGEWVKNILTRLGMKEGEAIESRMVSRRIEGAQKKVEERNFEIRKNLLEYDEVMDEQRKRVYGYRQRILDGANCKELILEMIDEQIDASSEHLPRQELRPRHVRQLGRQPVHLRDRSQAARGARFRRRRAAGARRSRTGRRIADLRSRRRKPARRGRGIANGIGKTWPSSSNTRWKTELPRSRFEEDRPRRSRAELLIERLARGDRQGRSERREAIPGRRFRRANRLRLGAAQVRHQARSGRDAQARRRTRSSNWFATGPSPPTTRRKSSIR